MPVGGLDRLQVQARLLEVYSLPVEMYYNDSVVLLHPSLAGFELDLESMLAAADLERTEQTFWTGFWDHLWGRRPEAKSIPLDSDFSETRLRTYLINEITTRYDQPPTPASPVVGTVFFEPGIEGTALDIERAIFLIENALQSPTQRTIQLPLRRTTPPPPAFQNLETLLKHSITTSGFDGLVSLYMLDLENGLEIHFAYQREELLSTQPDIAYTAASTIKIPIMVSVFKRIGENPDPETINLLSNMIAKSDNESSDAITQRVLDQNLGPLEITQDMHDLGLMNTFWAGYFDIGAPLLWRYETPSNLRTDVDTEPDPYNQTTVSDMGMLMEDIYQCAENGGGALIALYPEEITQSECQQMIDFLFQNEAPFLIEGGVPSDNVRVAHKHGWTAFNGIINTIGDAGIVYTPNRDYVLVIFLYHPVQLIWDPASTLVADLSSAVYNYYNIPQP